MNNDLLSSLSIILLVIVFMYIRFGKTKGLKTLNGEAFKRELEQSKEAVLIDVRESGEFKGGHIKGAKNIPLSELNLRLGDLPKDRDLLLYCRSGMRSKRAAKILLKNGFAKIAHLNGGLGAWSGPLLKR
ncbi:rhodanese-like domain-containing protein [Paenibacillus sp. IHBB 3054]|uniref:rhodanese-like domain-containing protein n=1 Tax=Paenibacillus sp. IHBB 3054 TaxID=3425689 RepID=UPI003F681EB5